jgi:hypothetical protein
MKLPVYTLRFSDMLRVRAIVFSIFLLLITLPYLQAVWASGPDHVFGGFFLNPMDGNTYLAKMRQGWEGAWQFRLPYTAEPGEGSYLFLFYLFLGHLARVSRLPLLLTFHLARAGAAILLLLAMDRFFHLIIPEDRTATLAWCLAALGTGMGWLAALGRWVSADMWVAEAYPFLASFSNPHFPLSLAIMAWMLFPPDENRIWLNGLRSLACGMILSLLSPFGAIVTGLVLSGTGLWQRLVEWKSPAAGAFPRRVSSQVLATGASVIGLALGSAPVMFYDFWVARIHPALAGWNAQNLTPTPPVWDVALSLSPALLFALVEAWAGRKTASRSPSYRMFILWAGIGLLLIFLPTSLQLRFMIGLFIPVAGLAAAGVERLSVGVARNRRNLAAILFGLALPSLLFIQLAAVFSLQTLSSSVYLTRGEEYAMRWIAGHTPDRALVLAAPDTGLLIPAHTGRRVIYGHPFETVNARVEKERVESFFQASSITGEQGLDFLVERNVDYVFFGPRERALGQPGILEELRLVYERDGVAIYATR